LGTASVQSDLSDMSASSGTLTATQTIDTTGNVFFGGVGYLGFKYITIEPSTTLIR